MNKELIKIFQKSLTPPPENSPSLIWEKILKREKRLARTRLSIFSIVGTVSFLGLIPIFKILLKDLAKSGFYEYLSIAFSNGGTLSLYWKELSFSLTEALPVISILETASLVFVFFLSLHYILKQIIRPTQQKSRLGQLSLSF